MSWQIEDDAPKPTQQWVIEDAPASVQAGASVNSIPRQLGLTARYGIEGLANAAQIGTEPLRYLLDKVTPDRSPSINSLVPGGAPTPPKSMPLGVVASQFSDWLGLPKPEGANERVIGDAARLVAGAGGLGGAASLATKAPGMVGQAAQLLSSNMPQQLSSAAGAGLLGGASREAGGTPLLQTGAALLGGVAGGLVPGAGASLYDAGKRLLTPAMAPQQLDAQISAVLNRAGVDYSQIPEQARQTMRREMASSLQAGKELDPQAVRRLADFATVGAVPTRGMVSQNPVQITREMNLAKTGANSADEGLQGLALIQNRNNSTLIRNLNEAGAAQGDPFRAGQSAIGAIQGQDEALNAGVSALYRQARDTSGRSASLDGAAFTGAANRALDDALLGGALPPTVAAHMNRIATGEVPFTVDYAEQLKTAMGNLQRATNDGQTRMALGVVRRALDETPLMPAAQVNPGNLPAVPGTVPPSPALLGQDSINAFNQARQAARARFGWQESGRPIEAALNGAQPDKFVQQFVVGGTLADARAVAQNAPTGEVKNAILAHLKEKAIGRGAADEVGKFSQSAYNRALSDIGERKLSLFFTPQEINQLQAVGRVASYAQVQPVGSAVNNSNSGALLLGRGYDALKGIAGKVPFGKAALLDPVQNIEISMRNRAALNVAPGLLAQQAQRQPMAQGLLLPGLAYGGLLAPQVAN